jgi:hypothetical protein
MDISLATSRGSTEQTSFEEVKCHRRNRKPLCGVGGVKSVINVRRLYLCGVENEYCFRIMRTALALVMERKRKLDCRLIVTSNLPTPVKIFGSSAVVSCVFESVLFISLYFGLLSSDCLRIAISGKCQVQ